MLNEETIGKMSSTEVRKRITDAQSKNNGKITPQKSNIHGHVTPKVIDYIVRNELY